MPTMLLVISDLCLASANCLDFKWPLKITHLSDSWGLPKSIQHKYILIRKSVLNHLDMLSHFPVSVETLYQELTPDEYYLLTYLNCFLSQFFLYFGFFHVVLGFSLFPLFFHPLSFFLLSLFFHLSKLPLHTAWRFPENTISLQPPLPPRSLTKKPSLLPFLPTVCLTCDFGDVGFFYFCWFHLILFITGSKQFFYLWRIR